MYVDVIRMYTKNPEFGSGREHKRQFMGPTCRARKEGEFALKKCQVAGRMSPE